MTILEKLDWLMSWNMDVPTRHKFQFICHELNKTELATQTETHSQLKLSIWRCTSRPATPSDIVVLIARNSQFTDELFAPFKLSSNRG